MATVFQVIIDENEFVRAGFGGRDEAEDPLNEMLRSRKAGKVVGGEEGEGSLTIEIEMDDRLTAQEAVATLLALLKSLRVPSGTKLKGVWTVD